MNADSAPRQMIMSIDQGTTNTKAVLVGADGQVMAVGSAAVGVAGVRGRLAGEHR